MNGHDAATELAWAAEELDASDATLLEQIAEAYAEFDPVPDGLVERIQFAITLDALQVEVATLTQLDLAVGGARSAATASETTRTVTVTAESVTTLITISRQPDASIRVDGWAVPGAGLGVEVLLALGSRNTEADDDGRFVFDDLPAGPAKFVLHATDADGAASTVVSPTIEL
ncbi:MAG TPA: hypothetical protein VFU98_17885 [Microlunatus sp.]|nr:hypothetical protein [Microlunatus sp.]